MGDSLRPGDGRVAWGLGGEEHQMYIAKLHLMLDFVGVVALPNKSSSTAARLTLSLLLY